MELIFYIVLFLKEFYDLGEKSMKGVNMRGVKG
jgi:hypothetical protein